jgi:hypothetical protein
MYRLTYALDQRIRPAVVSGVRSAALEVLGRGGGRSMAAKLLTTLPYWISWKRW